MCAGTEGAALSKPSRLVGLLALIFAGRVLGQTPTAQTVVNAASFEALLSPGVMAAVFGQNLSNGSCSASSAPLLTTLCDARVLVGDKAAPLAFASSTQLTIQVPVELSPGPAQVLVEVQGRRSAAVGLTLLSHSPGIFTVEGNSRPAAVKQGGAPVSEQNPATPGETVIVFAAGLGPTNPTAATGAPSPVASTTTQPRLTIAGQAAEIFYSGLTPGFVGTYQVNLRVPASLAEGTHPLILEIGGQRSNTVTLPVGKPVPAISSVVNGASFGSAGVAAPGSILTLFGANWGQRENLSVFPATVFEGLSVTFNTTAAPLFHVIPSRNQINLLAPMELPESGTATVQAKVPGAASASVSLRMVDADPGIFRVTDPTTPTKVFAAALLPGTRWLPLSESTARALGLPINCSAGGVDPLAFCAQPVRPGDVLQVFATGLGRATPAGDPAGRPLATGSIAPANGNPLYLTLIRPVVSVGGVPADVLFSGIAPGFSGLYQVNVRIPAGSPSGDEVSLRLSTPNSRADAVLIAVRP